MVQLQDYCFRSGTFPMKNAEQSFINCVHLSSSMIRWHELQIELTYSSYIYTILGEISLNRPMLDYVLGICVFEVEFMNQRLEVGLASKKDTWKKPASVPNYQREAFTAPDLDGGPFALWFVIRLSFPNVALLLSVSQRLPGVELRSTTTGLSTFLFLFTSC